jgi:hypothetical protein
MKKLIIMLAIVLSFICINSSAGHENETYRHGGIGICFGWKSLDHEKKLCYRNREHTICVILIYTHGEFHVTEEFECKTYDKTVGDDGPTELNNYGGPARVYALTCNLYGQLENENT